MKNRVYPVLCCTYLPDINVLYADAAQVSLFVFHGRFSVDCLHLTAFCRLSLWQPETRTRDETISFALRCLNLLEVLYNYWHHWNVCQHSIFVSETNPNSQEKLFLSIVHFLPVPRDVGQGGTVPIGLCPPKCEITNCTIRSKHGKTDPIICRFYNAKPRWNDIEVFFLGWCWELELGLLKKGQVFC